MSSLLPSASWPNDLVLQLPLISLDDEMLISLDDEAVDDMVDLGDFGPSPDTVLQLDDRHVSFLEEQDKVEESEVERLLSLVDQVNPQALAQCISEE